MTSVYSNPSDFSDFSMLDIFRMEAETQVAAMNDHLLALEAQSEAPDSGSMAKRLEALMRAAHSLKGAAHIVGLDAVVGVAHVIEDCFVAAQNGQLQLQSHHIDVLLDGVDWFMQLSQCPANELTPWLEHQANRIAELVGAIADLLHPIPTVSSTASSALSLTETSHPVNPKADLVTDNLSQNRTTDNSSDSSTDSSTDNSMSNVDRPVNPSNGNVDRDQGDDIHGDLSLPNRSSDFSDLESSQGLAGSQERVVRISADNLNQIMALAGESLVEANWLQSFTDTMLQLKRQQQALIQQLDKLHEEASLAPSAQQHLAAAQKTALDCHALLSERLGDFDQFSRRFSQLSDNLYREVIASHMRPFADGIQGFPRMVRDLAKQLGKQVQLQIKGQNTQVDRDILERLEVPLTHMLRNAVVHGIEPAAERLAAGKPEQGTIILEAMHRGGMLSITVSDDGCGINLDDLRQVIVQKHLTTTDLAAQLSEAELLEFLFLPRFSTAKQVTEMAGRGVGLDIAKSMVQEVGGLLRVSTQSGQGLTFSFQLPLTLSVIRALLVEIAGEPYAFGLTRIDQVLLIQPDEIRMGENRPYITVNDENISIVRAQQVMGLPDMDQSAPDLLPVVVVTDHAHRYGIIVDKFLDEKDLVVRPLDPRLGKVQDISAAALTEDGLPLLIIDVADLVCSIDQLIAGGHLNPLQQQTAIATPKTQQKRVLVVDDSITVREMERKLLQNRGYQVDVAINGMEGWNTVRTGKYDLVISDIDMPRMNGIELVRQIKNHPKLKSLPVIIVSYKDRQEDQLAGLDAGADYYLTKSSFHDNRLLNAVMDLIGD